MPICIGIRVCITLPIPWLDQEPIGSARHSKGQRHNDGAVAGEEEELTK